MDAHVTMPAAAAAHPSSPCAEGEQQSVPAPPIPAQAAPASSVVVVNYHHWPETASLVEQLHAGTALGTGLAEVVIVDNSLPAHPLVARLRRRSDVAVRRWRRNRGFAAAVNEGSRLSRGRWLLLLNPDVGLAPGFLDAVLAAAERLERSQPDVGVVGFRLRDPDGGVQGSTGNFPTLGSLVARLLLPRHRRKYHLWPPEQAGPVDWVTGCCLLVRRDCLEALGRVDAGFFLYYEDVDLCRRARLAGWRVWFEPDPEVIHHRPLHARRVPPHLRLITRHALLTYVRKHWPGWQAYALARLVQAEAWGRRLLSWWRGERRAVALFGVLSRLAGDMARNEPVTARRRLEAVIRRRERRLARLRKKGGEGSCPNSPS